MIGLNCPIARSLNAESGCGAAITESPTTLFSRRGGGVYETPFSRAKFSDGVRAKEGRRGGGREGGMGGLSCRRRRERAR